MAVIDVRRPTATVFNSGWTIAPSGTAHGVTADDSDATYVQDVIATNGQPLQLRAASHTPPAGHERHRIRSGIRAACVTERAPWRWHTMMPSYFGPSSSTIPQFSPTFTTVMGQWASDTQFQLGSPSGIQYEFQIYAAPANAADFNGIIRVSEVYWEIDCRANPSFSPEVQDGAGVNQDGSVITDTPSPTFVFGPIAYDGLNARTWTIEVRTDPGGVVVFSDSGVGQPPPGIDPGPLANGDYEADLQVFSTIRTNDAYASDVENLTFEIAFVAPASPVLTSSVISAPPSVLLEWESDTPTATAWDTDADVVTEIERLDCNGIRSFYMERTGVGAASHIDRFMSLCASGPFCGETVQALRMHGSASGQSFTADSAGISITGDIDIRVDLSLVDWTSRVAGQQTIVLKAGSYVLAIAAWTPDTARVTFAWQDTSLVSVQALPALPFGPGQRGKIRATHDVNDGSGGRITTFYYDIGDGWVQLGEPINFGTAGDIDDSANPLVVGVPFFGPGISPVGHIYSMELYDGIDGTLVASPDFTDPAQGWVIGDDAGDTGTDDQGNVWSLAGDGQIQESCCMVVYRARYWGLVDGVLVASEWSNISVETVSNPTPGNAWIRGGASGDQSVCPDESYVSVRPFGVFQPIGGGIPTVTSGSPGGRDYSLAIAVESEADLVALEAILAQTVVFYQPVGQADIWLAPNVLTAQITKVKRIRTVSIDTVAVNPQPVATPASFFA